MRLFAVQTAGTDTAFLQRGPRDCGDDIACAKIDPRGDRHRARGQTPPFDTTFCKAGRFPADLLKARLDFGGTTTGNVRSGSATKA